MTSLADIKAKFYNLLAEKKMAKQGKKVVALTSAVYHEITTSLAVINSGTNSARIYHFWARYCPYFKGWLKIAELKPLSLFISLLLMLKKAFDNVKVEK